MSDLFNMSADTGMDFLKEEKKTNDGLYKVKPELAKDKNKGYKATIRFLPNLTKEGKLGPNAIEKMQHYVKLQNHPELNGYYDSMRNFNESCDLTNLYWQLKNSNSVVDQENAENISRTTKYYSYVLIVEDENQPDLEGKILIFPFGYKIKEKIQQEMTGEITGEKCNVYDLANGKDFVLVVKNVGGYVNYDASQFRGNKSAITINGKEVPTEIADESTGRKTIAQNFQPKIQDFLNKREKEIEDFSPTKWTEEEKGKVAKIVSVLTNNPIVDAKKSINSASRGDIAEETLSTKSVSEVTSSSSDEDPDDFFNDF